MWRLLHRLVVPERHLQNLKHFADVGDGYRWGCHDCGWTAFSRDYDTLVGRVQEHLVSFEHTTTAGATS